MSVKTGCVSWGSRSKRSLLCGSGVGVSAWEMAGKGLPLREATGWVCREYIVSVSEVDLQLPRIWYVFSCLFISPTFTGIFACEMYEKSRLSRTRVEMASRL